MLRRRGDADCENSAVRLAGDRRALHMVLSAISLVLTPISSYKTSLAFFAVFHLIFWKCPYAQGFRIHAPFCWPLSDTAIDDHAHF